MPYNTEEIRHVYKSKYNLKRENQVILLMILMVKMTLSCSKKLPALFRGITSNNNRDFYCINCLHLYGTENKLKKHENISKHHDYCYVEMPNQDNKILKYNRG